MGYSQLIWLVRIIVRLFFRRIDVVGETRIPSSGATIFVANHANQFVDPMMLLMFIPRVVRFLIAAKSLKRPIIGDLARAARAVGVDRPQDLAKKGAGTVSASSATTVIGKGTSFTKDLEVGFKLKMGDVEVAVKSVDSDTSCTVSEYTETFADASYKIFPKVDQNAVYSKVHEALKSGDCIGIFPEGGSHDQAHMLDLKPGVAIMALGAMNAGVDAIRIVPCGLNYFEPYKFRSRVVLEFGEPLVVPAELAELYKTDKRAAVSSLMDLIEQGMKRVLPEAQDYKMMQAILTARSLWRPQDRKLTTEEIVRITKRFAQAMQKFKDDERVKPLVDEIVEYNNALQACGVKDRDVRHQLVDDRVLLRRSILSLCLVILLFPFSIAIAILFSPVAAVTYVSAIREQKTALAGSSVKVKALDVVASQKIKVGMVVVPLYLTLLAILIVFLSGLRWWWTFVFMFVILPIATVVAARTSDIFARHLWHCQTNWRLRCTSASKDLFSMRLSLQTQVRQLVEKLGPEVIDNFQESRIISKEEIHADTCKTLQMPLLRQVS
jgi:glycerol-3-phosphate O-acyltransferase/dihydroxyacetone phosphate acyltransferase